MKTYICLNCGYKTRKEQKPDRCNYCSKTGVIKEVEDADKILESIN